MMVVSYSITDVYLRVNIKTLLILKFYLTFFPNDENKLRERASCKAKMLNRNDIM